MCPSKRPGTGKTRFAAPIKAYGLVRLSGSSTAQTLPPAKPDLPSESNLNRTGFRPTPVPDLVRRLQAWRQRPLHA